MTTAAYFQPGDYVRFLECIESGDESALFVVLETGRGRGAGDDGVLVRDAVHHWSGTITPTFEYSAHELTLAEPEYILANGGAR
jgi:hypothetical protein